MAPNDLELQEVEALIQQARMSTLEKYKELIRVGNPPGQNTAQIAFIIYIAKSISSLQKDQIEHLRSQGILTI